MLSPFKCYTSYRIYESIIGYSRWSKLDEWRSQGFSSSPPVQYRLSSCKFCSQQHALWISLFYRNFFSERKSFVHIARQVRMSTFLLTLFLNSLQKSGHPWPSYIKSIQRSEFCYAQKRTSESEVCRIADTKKIHCRHQTTVQLKDPRTGFNSH